LEEKLSNNFSELHGFWISNQETSKLWKPLHLTIFEFVGHFFSQNDVFKLQEISSELEKGRGSLQTFLILHFSDKPEVLKRFQKQF
jgi:hypothetical protein